MALRSVLDINVNDAALDRLQQKIDKYQQTARNLPTINPLIGPGVPGGPGSVPGRPPPHIDMERSATAAERLSRAWGIMRDHSREVVRNVREMASRFLTITGLLGTLSGAATGFGFLGFDKLAKEATNLRTSAFGAGTTPGGLQASRIALGRFGDMPALMQKLKTGAQTPGSDAWQAMRLLGLNPQPGDDSFDLLQKFLPAIRDRYQAMERAHPGSGGLFLQTKQLQSLMSVDQMRQITGRGQELEQGLGQARELRGQLDVPQDKLSAFEDFIAKIKTAGASIETFLINRLSALAGPLGNLSQAITNLITGLMDRVLKQENIDAISAAIERLSKWLDSFHKEDFDHFIEGISHFVDAVESAAKTIKGWFDSATRQEPVVAPSDKPPGSPSDKTFHWFNQFNKGTRELFGLSPDDGTDDEAEKKRQQEIEKWRQDNNFYHPFIHPSSFQTGGANGIPIRANAALPVEIVGFRGFSDQKKQEPQAQPPPPWAGMIQQASFRVPANDDMNAGDLISRIAKVESNFDPMAESHAGAQGLMQFMPGTWRQYGQGSPFNPIEAIRAAQRYLAHLFSMPELGGDPAKVVASYNAGEGAVTAAIRKFGADWLSHLPKETQNYVPKVLGQSQSMRPDFHPVKPPHVGVTIQNETGGNVVTTHRLLAT